ERDQDLEGDEARDRVDQAGGDRDRLVERSQAMRGEGEPEREQKADRDGDQCQLRVLHEVRLERVTPVVAHPVPAEEMVARHAGVAVTEVRDDRAGVGGGHVRRSVVARSRVSVPRGEPSSPRTSTSVLPAPSISETAFLTVADVATVATSGACPRTG